MTRWIVVALVLIVGPLPALALDERPGCRTDLDGLLSLHEEVFESLYKIAGTKRPDIFGSFQGAQRSSPWPVKRPIATYKRLCQYGVDAVIPYMIKEVEYRIRCVPTDVNSERSLLESYVAISTPHSGDVTQVVFSPDGHTLVSAGEDHTIKVWDAASARVLRTIRAHEDTIIQIGISPDGQKIVSASEDETIRIWDMKSGTS